MMFQVTKSYQEQSLSHFFPIFLYPSYFQWLVKSAYFSLFPTTLGNLVYTAFTSVLPWSL